MRLESAIGEYVAKHQEAQWNQSDFKVYYSHKEQRDQIGRSKITSIGRQIDALGGGELLVQVFDWFVSCNSDPIAVEGVAVWWDGIGGFRR